MSGIILQGLSLSEFESLLDKMIAAAVHEAITIKENAPTQNETNTYLTRREAAKQLRISLPTLAKYSLAGLIPCHYIGARILYKQEEIDMALSKVQSQKFKA
jgi:hypothetical protein